MAMKALLQGRPSKKDSERDILKERTTQIDNFLNDVEGKKFMPMLRRREDPLGDMLSWGEHVYKEKSRMDQDLDSQDKAIQQLNKRIHEMQKRIESLQQEQNKLVGEKDSMNVEHASELSNIEQQRLWDKQEWDSKHQRQKESYENQIERLEKNHKKETDKLLGQLLVNQKDAQGWPDDKMGVKFGELQLLMESVTAPRNREFLIPAGRNLSSDLDRTNFLGRVGSGKSHFLLKSTLWAIIGEQFFSAPFGFGVLGPGKGKRELFEMYAAWRKLFNANAISASFDREDYAIFRQGGLANNWRSITFQCINVALTAPEQAQSPIARLSNDNFNETMARILKVLSEVASLSQAHVRVEIQDQVRQMVLLGRDIALQFGIQPAHLQLVVPKRGDQIKIGEKFHDCEDGDSYKGKLHNVDLVTAPGLQKIGDGRSDMNSQRAMVPCEIYPIETDS